MKIFVDRSHIDAGACHSPTRCMIAKAIKETTAASYVAVRTNLITVTLQNDDGSRIRQHFTVPLKAARAIVSFDQGEVVKPFSFVSKLIDETAVPVRSQKADRDRVRERNKRRKAAKAKGIPVPPQAPPRPRVAGV